MSTARERPSLEPTPTPATPCLPEPACRAGASQSAPSGLRVSCLAPIAALIPTLIAALIPAVLAVGAWSAAGLWSAAPARADDRGWDGEFRLGYRFVDVDGNPNKYRQDVDLDDGARLFELRLDYEDAQGTGTEDGSWLDRASLEIDSFGGDPFESLHVRAQRFGAFDFRFDRTESTYFYEDILLPVELGDPRLSDAGDFHHFDFDRVRDRAHLKVDLGVATELSFGFERFSKRGESSTTYDISRDEFELEQPVDETYDQFSVGFQHAWKKVTLVLEERQTEYENVIEALLPGASPGENPANATELDFYFYDRPYSYSAHEHVVRLQTRPTVSLWLNGSVIVQQLELDGEARERGAGTAFDGQPLEVDTVGETEIDRDGAFFDVDFGWRIHDRLALVGGVRQHQFDQDGRSQLGDERSEGTWDVETTSVSLGFDAQARADLTLSVGFLAEARDVEYLQAEGAPASSDLEEESTDHHGYFARLSWRPSKIWRLDASAENSTYDDPFTLSSPTDRQRFRVRARYTGANGIYGNASFLAYRFDNENSGWRADRDQWSARLGCRRQGLDLSVGYDRIETDDSVDQLVTTLPGFGGGVEFLYPVLYRSDSSFFDARLRWRPSARLSLGAETRFYDNAGSFAFERDDLRAFVELGVLDGYWLHLAYRTVQYDEDRFDWDDYEAEIMEISIGHRF